MPSPRVLRVIFLAVLMLFGSKWALAADELIVYPPNPDIPNLTIIGRVDPNPKPNQFFPYTDVETKVLMSWIDKINFEPDMQIFVVHAQNGKFLPGLIEPKSKIGSKIIASIEPCIKPHNLWISCSLASDVSEKRHWLKKVSLINPSAIHIGFSVPVLVVPTLTPEVARELRNQSPRLKDWASSRERSFAIVTHASEGNGRNHVRIIQGGHEIDALTLTPEPTTGIDLPNGRRVLASTNMINPWNAEHYVKAVENGVHDVPLMNYGARMGGGLPDRSRLHSWGRVGVANMVTPGNALMFLASRDKAMTRALDRATQAVLQYDPEELVVAKPLPFDLQIRVKQPLHTVLSAPQVISQHVGDTLEQAPYIGGVAAWARRKCAQASQWVDDNLTWDSSPAVDYPCVGLQRR